MATANGPDYEKVFLDGRMQWHVPEHALMIERYLKFYENTTNYKGLYDDYSKKKEVNDLFLSGKMDYPEHADLITQYLAYYRNHEKVGELKALYQEKKAKHEKKEHKAEVKEEVPSDVPVTVVSEVSVEEPKKKGRKKKSSHSK